MISFSFSKKYPLPLQFYDFHTVKYKIILRLNIIIINNINIYIIKQRIRKEFYIYSFEIFEKSQRCLQELLHFSYIAVIYQNIVNIVINKGFVKNLLKLQ